MQSVADDMQKIAEESESVDCHFFVWYKRITESANDCTRRKPPGARAGRAKWIGLKRFKKNKFG